MEIAGNRKRPVTPSAATARTDTVAVVLVIAWVVVLPWLMAGLMWWVAAVGVGIGVVALALALLAPANRPTLFCYPVFWLGLAFLGWLCCQALNPWAEAVPLRPGAKVWHLQYLEHVLWLPAGVRANYFEMNGWRTLVFWTGPWLLACAWWAAANRRRHGQWLWWAVFLNGVALALTGMAKAYFPTYKGLWFYTAPDIDKWAKWFASFLNRTDASIFLFLTLGAGFALAITLRHREIEEGRNRGFPYVILLGCVILLAGTIAAGSRFGLLGGILVFLAGAWFWIRTQAAGESGAASALVPAAVFLLLAAAVVGMAFLKVFPWSVVRLVNEVSTISEDPRYVVWEATARMVEDRPWLGYGAGSFKYVSPYYFRALDKFVDPSYVGGLGLRANYAHNDGLHFIMEYGLVGAGLLFSMLFYWYWLAWRHARRLGLAGGIVVLATVVALLNAQVNFPFFNLAVTTLFVLLLAGTAKMGAIEAQRESAYRARLAPA